MQTLFYNMPTLAIAALYCLWHHHEQWQRRRERMQRARIRCERVAYMLWVMANQVS